MQTTIKIITLITILVLIFCSCGKTQKTAPGAVGMVFDVGGKGDKSFNDGSYAGLMRAVNEFKIEHIEFEPGQDADKEVGLRKLAQNGYSVIIGVGYLFTDVITKTAKDFPNTKFACIDYDVRDGMSIPPNLSAIKFREEEGSYLVGAIAGLTTKTGIIGFVGGMDIPLIHKFEAGYKAGALAVKPDIKILVDYAGSSPQAFADPVRGKELALAQYNKGADIIFQAAGSTGLGVLEAAKEKKQYVIWVDSNGNYLAPGRVLTSMLKKVDVAVYETIKANQEGKFVGGIREFGLKEDGVGFALDEYNKDLISKETLDKVNELKAKIIAGEITVPKK